MINWGLPRFIVFMLWCVIVGNLFSRVVTRADIPPLAQWCIAAAAAWMVMDGWMTANEIRRRRRK